jgi:hypothetical protein
LHRAWLVFGFAVLAAGLGACSSKVTPGSRNDGGPQVPSCRSSLDCTLDKICDPSIAQCVDCVASTDCPPSNDCVARTCVPYVSCMTSLGCPAGQVCNATTQRCVACVTDADCADTSKACVANACRTMCASDKTCVPLGLLCDQASMTCVSCIQSTDCASGQICRGGACVTGVCQPGQSSCVLNAIRTCNATGDDYAGAGTPCDPLTCTVTASGAACAAVAPGSGGTSGGGAGGAPGGVSLDPSAYADVFLLASCENPINESYGGYWWSADDGDGVIDPPPNASFYMQDAGYIGKGVHVTGSVMTGHALFGDEIQSSTLPFDASMYDGLSFWGKADVSTLVRVGVGQPNTEMGTCQADAGGTCYDHPSLNVQLGTTWTRFVVPFAALVPENGPNPNVPTTPSMIKHVQWGILSAGAFSVYVDEIYFVKHK